VTASYGSREKGLMRRRKRIVLKKTHEVQIGHQTFHHTFPMATTPKVLQFGGSAAAGPGSKPPRECTSSLPPPRKRAAFRTLYPSHGSRSPGRCLRLLISVRYL